MLRDYRTSLFFSDFFIGNKEKAQRLQADQKIWPDRNLFLTP
jgi:hypothetical protein